MSKRDTLKEAVSQIMFCCSGEKEQYDETVNAVLGAVEVYVTQLAKTAIQNMPNESAQIKISPNNIIEALACDPRKQSFLQSFTEKNKSNPND